MKFYHLKYILKKKESSNFAKQFKQKLPANISEEDLLNFSVRQEYDILRVQCPLLFHVVTGAMGLTEGELEVLKGSFGLLLI